MVISAEDRTIYEEGRNEEKGLVIVDVSNVLGGIEGLDTDEGVDEALDDSGEGVEEEFCDWSAYSETNCG